MVSFSFEDLLTSGPTGYMTGISAQDTRMSVDGPVLYAASGPDGGISCYRLTAGSFSGDATFRGLEVEVTVEAVEDTPD